MLHGDALHFLQGHALGTVVQKTGLFRLPLVDAVNPGQTAGRAGDGERMSKAAGIQGPEELLHPGIRLADMGGGPVQPLGHTEFAHRREEIRRGRSGGQGVANLGGRDGDRVHPDDREPAAQGGEPILFRLKGVQGGFLRPGTNQKGAQGKDFFNPVPAGELQHPVGPDEIVKLGLGPGFFQREKGINRITGGGTVHLQPGGNEPRILRAGGDDHLPPVFPGNDAGLVGLVPGGENQHAGQPAEIQRRDGHADMPLMNRIEHAPQNTDAFFGQRNVLLLSCLYYRRFGDGRKGVERKNSREKT